MNVGEIPGALIGIFKEGKVLTQDFTKFESTNHTGWLHVGFSIGSGDIVLSTQ